MIRTGSSIRFATTLLASLLTIAASGHAQVFDLEKDHVRLASVNGLWRFHTGDDADGKLGWAKPTFDDSHWALLRSDRSWTSQGYRDYSRVAWYRFKVLLPETNGATQYEHLGILIPRIHSSYQIFVDGELIGSFGKMPPHGEYFIGFDQIFPLSPGKTPSGRELSIAIRVWQMGWFDQVGGPEGAATVGEPGALEDLKTEDDRANFWSITSGNALMLMNMVAAFAGFFLFWMRPADREYLWFALYELLTGIEHLCIDWAMFYPTSWSGLRLVDACLSAASWPLFLVFVFRILNGRRNWFFWAGVGTAPAIVLVNLATLAQWLSINQCRDISALCLIPYLVCILALLYRSARQGVPDAQLMIVPVAICYISWYMYILLVIIAASGQGWVDRDFEWFFQLSRWPFPFSFQDVADMVMLLGVMAVLPLRFARSRRDEEWLAREMESARTVQQVLIPTEIPSIPGFDIQCVYKPAGQVGGDFFQIIPIASGSSLIAIGDVSGKGMPAAMTVSLLVGTVQTLADATGSPCEILSAMNHRMLTRSHGGFTTCLVLRVDPDGTLTMANAGHIAPYLAGQELTLKNSLPLGISADTIYLESTFQILAGQQLTLLTDGVVEARNSSGALFGFEATAAISAESAHQIATTAELFGQEDDITVLSVTRAIDLNPALT